MYQHSDLTASVGEGYHQSNLTICFLLSQLLTSPLFPRILTLGTYTGHASYPTSFPPPKCIHIVLSPTLTPLTCHQLLHKVSPLFLLHQSYTLSQLNSVLNKIHISCFIPHSCPSNWKLWKTYSWCWGRYTLPFSLIFTLTHLNHSKLWGHGGIRPQTMYWGTTPSASIIITADFTPQIST